MTEAENPFEAPAADTAVVPVSDHDAYIIGEVTPLLRADEDVLWTAFLQRAPSLWIQILFNGLVMLFFIRHFLVAVTNQRLILIRTGIGLARPKLQNRGVETIDWATVDHLTVGGFANNRSIDFHFVDGTKRTLRISPWAKYVRGQADFFEFVQSFDTRKREVSRPPTS